MDKIIDIIKKAVTLKFYGKITITFESGKPVALKKEETVKL